MREGWVETTLGEVVTVVNGGTPSTKNESYWGGSIIWITTTELTAFDGKSVNDSKRTITEAGLNSGPARMVQSGTTLVGTTATIGTCAIAACNLTFNQQISGLVAKNKDLNDQYLFYWIQFIKPILEGLSAGTSFKRISTSVLKSVAINLPPLPEQKRIVDLISSVDSYIEVLQKQLESAKRSRNAVLHELLTAGGDDWVETTLGEVTQINPEQAKDFDSERLIKYVDLSTVTFDNGIDSEIDPIPFNEAPGRARRIIRENDVIVATVRPYLKGFAFVNKDFNEQIASTGFCVIRAESELILPELVWALIGSDDFVDFLVGRSTGSSYPAVRPTDISEFRFMLPPFKDQETVSQLIKTFDQLIKDSTNLINSTQNLRSGLLSDLLSGAHEIPASYDKVMGAA